MDYKPVGADTTTSLFPPRVMNALADVFLGVGTASASDVNAVPRLSLLVVSQVDTNPSIGCIQPYDTSLGPLSPILPSLSELDSDTSWLGVQKADSDTSSNLIEVTCADNDTFDSGDIAISLQAPGELRILQVVTVNDVKCWKVVTGNVPLLYFQNNFEPAGLSAGTLYSLDENYITRPSLGEAGQVLSLQDDGTVAWINESSAQDSSDVRTVLDTDGVPYFESQIRWYFDTDGTPYWSSINYGDTPAYVHLDTDGTPYFATT